MGFILGSIEFFTHGVHNAKNSNCVKCLSIGCVLSALSAFFSFNVSLMFKFLAMVIVCCTDIFSLEAHALGPFDLK